MRDSETATVFISAHFSISDS